MGNKDLAVDLRIRMGDWFRVEQLIQENDAGNDQLLSQAWKNIGDYYTDRLKWYSYFFVIA